jgi:dephospho-CoA kinase
MIVIGLTGGPGTGKSLVAEFLAANGAVVLSGDEAGKRVVDNNRGILKKLVSTFGETILNSNGTLNRGKLGKIVFEDNNQLFKLNEFIHPPLLKLLKSDLRKAITKHAKFVVIDAALIFEWGIANWCDYILVVTAKRDIRIKRLISKGLTRKEAINRIASQIPDSEKAAMADFVIENNGTKAQLQKQVKAFLKVLP